MADLIINIGWFESDGTTAIPNFSDVSSVNVSVSVDGGSATTETVLAADAWAEIIADAVVGTYVLTGQAVAGFVNPSAVTVEMGDTEDEEATINYVRSATMPYDDSTYCDFDSTIAAVTAGKDILFCLFDSTGANLLALAGQQSFDLSIEADSQDASTKDNKGGWGAEIAGTKNWTVSVEGLMAKGDESQRQLLQAFVNSKLLCMKVVEEITDDDGAVTYDPLYGGLVNTTSYSDSAPFDDMRSYTAEFAGVGKLWIAAIATPEEIAAATAVPSNRGQ